MLAIHTSSITEQQSLENNFECAAVDSASLMAAQLKGQSIYEGCPLPAVHVVAIQPAEDIVIPIFVCDVHHNGFKLGLREGVGIDQDLLE